MPRKTSISEEPASFAGYTALGTNPSVEKPSKGALKPPHHLPWDENEDEADAQTKDKQQNGELAFGNVRSMGMVRSSIMLAQLTGSEKIEKQVMLPPPPPRDVRDEAMRIRLRVDELISKRIRLEGSSPEEFWMPFCIEDGVWVFDVENLTDKRPDNDEYPGYVIFEHRTNYIWGSKILGFLFEFLTEFMDHVTDFAMLPMIFMSSSYENVPMVWKLAFITVMSIAQGIAVSLAIQETRRSMEKELEKGFWHCRYAFATCALLEFLSGPEDLLDAPKFMTNDRNYGMVGTPPAPLISLGVEAQRNYMEDRRFLSKVPIIILEDVVLQGINLTMTKLYCNGFPIAALISISCSCFRTMGNLMHVYSWCLAFRACKRYRLARCVDEKMPEIVRTITKKALDEMVAQCPIL